MQMVRDLHTFPWHVGLSYFPLSEKKSRCQRCAHLIIGQETLTLRLRTPRITVLRQQGEG